MHDTIRLETLGIPSVPIATTEFRTAARVQAAALGRPDMEAIYVAHPIQDQTEEEIRSRARDIFEHLVATLTVPPDQSE